MTRTPRLHRWNLRVRLNFAALSSLASHELSKIASNSFARAGNGDIALAAPCRNTLGSWSAGRAPCLWHRVHLQWSESFLITASPCKHTLVGKLEAPPKCSHLNTFRIPCAPCRLRIVGLLSDHMINTSR